MSLSVGNRRTTSETIWFCSSTLYTGTTGNLWKSYRPLILKVLRALKLGRNGLKPSRFSLRHRDETQICLGRRLKERPMWVIQLSCYSIERLPIYGWSRASKVWTLSSVRTHTSGDAVRQFLVKSWRLALSSSHRSLCSKWASLRIQPQCILSAWNLACSPHHY
jgi:hypothetical protein